MLLLSTGFLLCDDWLIRFGQGAPNLESIAKARVLLMRSTKTIDMVQTFSLSSFFIIKFIFCYIYTRIVILDYLFLFLLPDAASSHWQQFKRRSQTRSCERRYWIQEHPLQLSLQKRCEGRVAYFSTSQELYYWYCTFYVLKLLVNKILFLMIIFLNN